MSKYPNWTEKENEILIEKYKESSKEELLNLLPQRNWQAITIRGSRLGLYRMNYFTEDDIDFIKNNYKNMTSEEIAQEIGRDFGSVSKKIRDLGIIRQKFWTDEENEIIKNNYRKYPAEYISEFLLKDRTANSIRHQFQYLKLSTSRNHYTGKELLDLLKSLADKLGRTPTTQELPIYGLPHNGTFSRLFGGYNNACEILGLDINGTIFNQTKKYLSKSGDICDSKAEQIITDFMIDNHIQYSKGGAYKRLCSLGNSGKKRYDWLLENSIIVEYFGLNRHKKYQERMKQKIELCGLNNIELIQIFDKDISRLEKIFEKFIKS